MYLRRKIKVTVNLVDALLIKWWSAFIAIQCRRLSFLRICFQILSSKANKNKLLIDFFPCNVSLVLTENQSLNRKSSSFCIDINDDD